MLRHFARSDLLAFDVFRRQSQAYTAQRPGVRVVVEEHREDWYTRLLAQLAGGTPPDSVFECDCTIGATVQAGLLENLEPYLAQEKRYRASDVLGAAWFASTYQGKRWGLPWDSGSMALFWNTELFQRAGLPPLRPRERISWERLVYLATRLTLDMQGRHPDDPAFDPYHVQQYGFTYHPAHWHTFVFGAGGEVIAPDGRVPLDEPAAVEGLQFLADLAFRYRVSPSPLYPQETRFSFRNGNVGMHWDGVWQLGRHLAARVPLEVAPFPRGQVAVSYGHYSPLALLTAGRQKAAAWDWIWFATLTEAGGSIVTQAGLNVPPLVKLHRQFLRIGDGVRSREVFLNELHPRTLRVPGDRYGSYYGGRVIEFRRVYAQYMAPVWRGVAAVREATAALRPHLIGKGHGTRLRRPSRRRRALREM